MGDQQVWCVGAFTDLTVFDFEAGAAQRVDHVGHRTEVKAVSREWQLRHHIGVGQSDDESTPAVYHPGKLCERSVELRDEVDPI